MVHKILNGSRQLSAVFFGLFVFYFSSFLATSIVPLNSPFPNRPYYLFIIINLFDIRLDVFLEKYIRKLLFPYEKNVRYLINFKCEI